MVLTSCVISGVHYRRHGAPSGSSEWRTYPAFSAEGVVSRIETDPVGADVGTDNPYVGGGGNENNAPSGDLTSRLADAADFSKCYLDGISTPCAIVQKVIAMDAAAIEYRVREKAKTKPSLGAGSRPGAWTWNTVEVPIIDLGVGLFMTLFPTVKGGPAVPSTNDEGRYLDWEEGLFTLLQNPQQQQPAQRADQLVDDCRVRAMLDAIAWAEGTAGDADGGYGRVVRGTVISAPNNPGLVGQSNVTITNFAQHPNILVQVRPGLNSTAAGRYQFLHRTWTGFNLADFGERNQDIGAVMLLQQAGSINPLLTGDVRLAASNANGTWASLPNSPYGQPTRAMADFQTAYNNALAACQRPPGVHIW